MTGDEKILNIESQLTLIERGKINTLSCPYCGEIIPQGARFCCVKMIAAAEAIVDRKVIQDQADQAARIADQASKN